MELKFLFDLPVLEPQCDDMRICNKYSQSNKYFMQENMILNEIEMFQVIVWKVYVMKIII